VRLKTKKLRDSTQRSGERQNPADIDWFGLVWIGLNCLSVEFKIERV